MTNNPLSGYFRSPSLTVALPSRGIFCGFHTNETTGEVPVLPMTSADELIFNQPDLLLSGGASLRVIKSCVPEIVNTDLLSVSDIDVLMFAIKKATHGDAYKYHVGCPSCEKEFEMEESISSILGSATQMPEEGIIECRLSDELIAGVRQTLYSDFVKMQLAILKYAKYSQANGGKVDEEYSNKTQEEIMKLQMHILTNTIAYISTPETKVTETSFIAEFLDNAPKTLIAKLKETVEQAVQLGLDLKRTYQCPECGHVWDTSIAIDPSTFFA